jgi:hypothetical protein
MFAASYFNIKLVHPTSKDSALELFFGIAVIDAHELGRFS